MKKPKILTRDEPTATLIEQGLKFYLLADVTINDIQKFWNKNDLRTQTGKILTRQNAIELLRNEFYCGNMECVAFGMRVIGKHPALITLDEFYKNQEKLDKELDAPLKIRASKDWPLKGLLRCKFCRAWLNTKRTKSKLGKVYGYYYCNTPGCRQVRGNKESVEKKFLAKICGIVVSTSEEIIEELKVIDWGHVRSKLYPGGIYFDGQVFSNVTFDDKDL